MSPVTPIIAWVILCLLAGGVAETFTPGWRGVILAIVLGVFLVAAKWIGRWMDAR